MPTIDLSPISDLCQNSLAAILDHYTATELDETVLDLILTVKSAKDSTRQLSEWLEHARKYPPPRQSAEDRAELRDVRSHIGLALLELASYLEHFETLEKISPGSEWQIAYRTFDELYPVHRLSYAPDASLSQRLERLDSPGVSDLLTPADTIDAIAQSLDWLTSYGTVLKLLSGSSSSRVVQTVNHDRSSSSRNVSGSSEASRDGLLSPTPSSKSVFSSPRSVFDDITTPRISRRSSLASKSTLSISPNYTRVDRCHVDIAALDELRLPWELDPENEHVVIVRKELSTPEQQRLFDTTDRLRAQHRQQQQSRVLRLEQERPSEFPFIRRRSESEHESGLKRPRDARRPVQSQQRSWSPPPPELDKQLVRVPVNRPPQPDTSPSVTRLRKMQRQDRVEERAAETRNSRESLRIRDCGPQESGLPGQGRTRLVKPPTQSYPPVSLHRLPRQPDTDVYGRVMATAPGRSSDLGAAASTPRTSVDRKASLPNLGRKRSTVAQQAWGGTESPQQSDAED